jgi:hypothetical protein
MMIQNIFRCVAVVVVLVVLVKPSSAAMCAPGQGIRKFDILSAVSGLLGGGTPRSGPTCQPCRCDIPSCDHEVAD